MADDLTAVVLAQAGKYVILDVGADKVVQVGDVFEAGDLIRILHPRRGDKQGDAQYFEALGVMVELYVERVFADYCLTVMTYSDRMPYFDNADIKAGKCKVRRGHPHRVTGTAPVLNQDKR